MQKIHINNKITYDYYSLKKNKKHDIAKDLNIHGKQTRYVNIPVKIPYTIKKSNDKQQKIHLPGAGSFSFSSVGSEFSVGVC